jgi:6-phosphofructokinase
MGNNMISTEQQRIVQLLRRQKPFATISGEEWDTLFSFFQQHRFRAGETIIAEGGEGRNAYILIEGECSLVKLGLAIKHYESGDYFGEFALLDEQTRTGSIVAETDALVYSLSGEDLSDAGRIPPALSSKIFKGFAQQLSSFIREGFSLYRNIDVLIVQDGGCAPGYNPVTAYLSEYLEKAGFHVFISTAGFRSIVSNQNSDYRCLVYNKELYSQIEHIPGVVFSPPLREARGANFRAERYPEFKDTNLQKEAASNLERRNVKVVIGVGGNGTFAGTKALSRFFQSGVQVFFIPVTIDSDVSGTECIGEYTGVEIGAEKIRCYMADARTHKRLYIIELMGAKGGYHALHSCLGAGAHLAVLPNQEHDLPALAEALRNRDGTVIVVAEGYKLFQRKESGYSGNAAEYFRDELLKAGLDTSQKIVCEPFSRDIRGASPNNMDIMLAQRMARKLVDLVQKGATLVMPAVLSNREYSIPFDDIRTDNSVESELATLANRLL